MKEFLSLFAGAGGLDLGLERSGWRCLYGVDSDPEAVRTLQLNQGEDFGAGAIFECADVRGLSGREVLRRIGRKKGEVADVLEATMDAMPIRHRRWIFT